MSAWWQGNQVSDADEDAGRCVMFKHSFLFGTFQCEEAATHLVTMVCVHEHVMQLPHCKTCTDVMVTRPMYCNACTESAETHECRVRASAAPLTAVSP